MDNLNEKIYEMLTDLQKEIEMVNRELELLPEGRLAYTKQRGRYHFVQEIRQNGQRIRKNLKPEDSRIRGLIKKEVFQKQLDYLESNYRHLNRIGLKIKDFSFGEEIFRLKTEIPALSEDLITRAFTDSEADEWVSEPYEKLNFQNLNTRWHITSFGLRVRSKSELLIAELLHKYGISFRYEQLIHIGENTFAPDFTIRRADGKIFYWEHAGLTNSQEYITHQMKKEQMYASAGIVPWDNLIVTYDNSDGIIDLRIVEFEIRNRLL